MRMRCILMSICMALFVPAHAAARLISRASWPRRLFGFLGILVRSLQAIVSMDADDEETPMSGRD